MTTVHLKKVEKYRPRRNNCNNSVSSNVQRVSDNYTSCPFQDGFLTLLIPGIFMHKAFIRFVRNLLPLSELIKLIIPITMVSKLMDNYLFAQ